MNMSQGGERGVGTSKDKGEDKWIIVGKLISALIPTSLPMKVVMTNLTTTTASNVKIDMSKLQSKKWLNKNKGGSSSTSKPVTTSNPKDKENLSMSKP